MCDEIDQAHRLPRRRVEMHHSMGILARHVDRAVNGETGGIDRVRRRFHRAALKVDLDQIGRGDFVEHQAIRVDQEVMLRPRQAHRDVGEDQVGHAKVRDQAIAGGQFLAQLLLSCIAIHCAPQAER